MRILIAEDDPVLGAQLQTALEAAGFGTDLVRDGIDAQHLGETEALDAVVLDLGLPGRDGLRVLSAWRAAGIGIPVLILTARASWQERVMGIDAGADDYLGKPFRMEELVARLRALLRRAHGQTQAVLVRGPVRLDTLRCTLDVDGRETPLTAHEYRVLSYLMHHGDQLVPRQDLAEHVYPQDADRDSNTLDVFIARLRRKLPPDFILTVRGLGWRLGDPA